MEIKELLTKIKQDFPEDAINISESLGLLELTLEDTHESIQKKISELSSKKLYDNIKKYLELGNSLSDAEQKIQDILSMLVIEDNEPVLADVAEETKEHGEIPDYDQYRVDTFVEHTLYENFTHKRPYAFRLAQFEIEKANNWQEMLVKVCALLYSIDHEKFRTFENQKRVNGKKRKNFSTSTEGMRTPKEVIDGMYVEANHSANSIRNLITSMLKEYDYKMSDFIIYLRADYTELNKK